MMDHNPQPYEPKHGKPYNEGDDFHKAIMDAIWHNSGMFSPYEPRHAKKEEEPNN